MKNRAGKLFKMGRNEEALQACKRSIAINPDYTHGYDLLKKIEKSRKAHRHKDKDRVVPSSDGAIRIGPPAEAQLAETQSAETHPADAQPADAQSATRVMTMQEKAERILSRFDSSGTGRLLFADFNALQVATRGEGTAVEEPAFEGLCTLVYADAVLGLNVADLTHIYGLSENLSELEETYAQLFGDAGQPPHEAEPTAGVGSAEEGEDDEEDVVAVRGVRAFLSSLDCADVTDAVVAELKTGKLSPSAWVDVLSDMQSASQLAGFVASLVASNETAATDPASDVKEEEPKQLAYTLAFSSDCTLLACSGSNGDVVVRNATTGESVFTIPSVGACSTISFSADDNVLATLTASNVLTFWRISEDEMSNRASGSKVAKCVRSFAFSPCGQHLAYSVADGEEAALYIAAMAEPTVPVGDIPVAAPGAVNFSTDGTIVCLVNGSQCTLYSVGDGGSIGTAACVREISTVRFQTSGAEEYLFCFTGDANYEVFVVGQGGVEPRHCRLSSAADTNSAPAGSTMECTMFRQGADLWMGRYRADHTLSMRRVEDSELGLATSPGAMVSSHASVSDLPEGVPPPKTKAVDVAAKASVDDPLPVYVLRGYFEGTGELGFEFEETIAGRAKVSAISQVLPSGDVDQGCTGMVLRSVILDGSIEELLLEDTPFDTAMNVLRCSQRPLTIIFEHPWQEFRVDDKATYFFNSDTSQSEWTKPEEMLSVESTECDRNVLDAGVHQPPPDTENHQAISGAELGQRFLSEGAFEPALHCFSAILSRDPKNEEAITGSKVAEQGMATNTVEQTAAQLYEMKLAAGSESNCEHECVAAGFSPDGKLIASLNGDGNLAMFTTSSLAGAGDGSIGALLQGSMQLKEPIGAAKDSAGFEVIASGTDALQVGVTVRETSDVSAHTGFIGAMWNQQGISVVHRTGPLAHKTEVIGSSHPYKNNETTTTSLKFERQAWVRVSFDPRCHTETNCDFLKITSEDDADFEKTLHGHGGEAWPNFECLASELHFNFTSDGSRTEWGWRCTVESTVYTQPSLRVVHIPLPLKVSRDDRIGCRILKPTLTITDCPNVSVFSSILNVHLNLFEFNGRYSYCGVTNGQPAFKHENGTMHLFYLSRENTHHMNHPEWALHNATSSPDGIRWIFKKARKSEHFPSGAHDWHYFAGHTDGGKENYKRIRLNIASETNTAENALLFTKNAKVLYKLPVPQLADTDLFPTVSIGPGQTCHFVQPETELSLYSALMRTPGHKAIIRLELAIASANSIVSSDDGPNAMKLPDFPSVDAWMDAAEDAWEDSCHQVDAQSSGVILDLNSPADLGVGLEPEPEPEPASKAVSDDWSLAHDEQLVQLMDVMNSERNALVAQYDDSVPSRSFEVSEGGKRVHLRSRCTVLCRHDLIRTHDFIQSANITDVSELVGRSIRYWTAAGDQWAAQIVGQDVSKHMPFMLANVTEMRTGKQIPSERIQLDLEAQTWTDSYGHTDESFRMVEDSDQVGGEGELYSITVRIDSNDQSLVGVAFDDVQVDTHLGGARGGWGYFSEGKVIAESEFRVPNNATVADAKYKRGDSIQCTFDAGTREVCFYKNDVLIHTENVLPKADKAVRFAVGGTPGSAMTIISESLLPAATASIRLDSTAVDGGGLVEFPLLQSVDLQALKRRAAFLGRYSALVMSVLALVDLDQGDCTGSSACGVIGMLRGILLTEHKTPAIGRTLERIRRRGSQVRMPEFKVSRGRARLGTELAADGSDSIAFQIYHALQLQNASAREELYHGRELWWKVEFLGEGVQDCGGGFRESVSDIASDLMSARTPLFIPSPNQEAWAGDLRDAFVPNPSCTSKTALAVYEWIGRLFAAAILSDESIPVSFPPLCWKLLSGAAVSMEDLRQVDEWFYQMLLQMERCVCVVDGVQVPITPEEFAFTFSQTYEVTLSDGSLVPLLEGGASREVDFDSRHEFIALAVAWRLDEFEAQITALRRGLVGIIPAQVLQLWTAAELERRVCGVPSVSVLAIRDAARYDMDRAAPEIALLWEALEKMSHEERSKFLRFVTGRSRLPASIKIARGGEATCLPQSATCFSILRLPAYTTVEETLEKLRYAIHNCMAIDTDGVRAAESFG